MKNLQIHSITRFKAYNNFYSRLHDQPYYPQVMSKGLSFVCSYATLAKVIARDWQSDSANNTSKPKNDRVYSQKLKNVITSCFSSASASTQLPALTMPFIAGLIDGDGFFKVHTSTGELRIVGHEKCRLFNQLQMQFGGHIRAEKGKQAKRYFLNSRNAKNGKSGLIKMISELNGHIRNSVRITQFKKMCLALGINYKTAPPITLDTGYLAGFFIADGSVYINASYSAKTQITLINKPASKEIDLVDVNFADNKSKGNSAKTSALINHRISKLTNGVAPRVFLKITNKYLVNLSEIAALFNTRVQLDKGKPGLKDYSTNYLLIHEKSEILRFLTYMNNYRSSSIKHTRLDLLETFFDLVEKKAHLSLPNLPDKANAQKKLWSEFVASWYSDRII